MESAEQKHVERRFQRIDRGGVLANKAIVITTDYRDKNDGNNGYGSDKDDENCRPQSIIRA